MRTRFYKKAIHILKKRDNPAQLYKRHDTDNEFIYQLYPVDKFGNNITSKTNPEITVPNFHMQLADKKTFEELRPRPTDYK